MINNKIKWLQRGYNMVTVYIIITSFKIWSLAKNMLYVLRTIKLYRNHQTDSHQTNNHQTGNRQTDNCQTNYHPTIFY